MAKIELGEVSDILDGVIEEQKALRQQAADLREQKDAIDEELKQLEIRFHRGAGGVLVLNELLNRHGEFPQLKSSERIFEEFDIPMTDDEDAALEERVKPPAGISEQELNRRREIVYERQAMDWIGVLDRRDNEDDGRGPGVGAGGGSVGESGPAREKLVGGESNEREPETGRPE